MKPVSLHIITSKYRRVRNFLTLAGIAAGLSLFTGFVMSATANAESDSAPLLTQMQITLKPDQTVERKSTFFFGPQVTKETGCNNEIVKEFINKNKNSNPECTLSNGEIIVKENYSGDQVNLVDPAIKIRWNTSKEEVTVQKPELDNQSKTVLTILFPGTITKPSSPINNSSTDRMFIGTLADSVDATASYTSEDAIFDYGVLILSIILPLSVIGCGVYFVIVRRREILEARSTRAFKKSMNQLLSPFEKNQRGRTASFRLPRLPARPRMAPLPGKSPAGPDRKVSANPVAGKSANPVVRNPIVKKPGNSNLSQTKTPIHAGPNSSLAGKNLPSKTVAPSLPMRGNRANTVAKPIQPNALQRSNRMSSANSSVLPKTSSSSALPKDSKQISNIVTPSNSPENMDKTRAIKVIPNYKK